MTKIGVGIIGASPLSPGWALAAHVPAVQALPEFELRAVSTSRRESADAASKQLGVPAFASVDALLAHPGVDLVVVAVKAPDHAALVTAALAATKLVFCEWPLGVSLAEAELLAARARGSDARTFIGLQARFAPAVRHARELIAQGHIGAVLATTLSGSGMVWGARAQRAQSYWFDARSGANTISVPTIHALEAVTYVLGEFQTVTATSAIRRTSVTIIETGNATPVTAPDHVSISGTLVGGAIASVAYRGDTSRAGNLRWEINGTEGDLLITAENGNLQVADLVLASGRGTDTTLHAVDLPGEATGFGANTLREYMAIARDVRTGSRLAPDFAHAVARHRLLAAIETAASTGQSQQVAS
jgi:predicted dehydrogenase